MSSSDPERFDAEGYFADEKTKGYIRDLLKSLAVWTELIRQATDQASD